MRARGRETKNTQPRTGRRAVSSPGPPAAGMQRRRAPCFQGARRPGSGQEVEAQVRGTDKDAVEAAFAEARAQAVDRAQNPGKYGDTDEW